MKVKFNKDKQAVGVVYRRHGIERFVKAKKEVILSAGAIDTPKLLMLSGVGPRNHLRRLRVALCLLSKNAPTSLISPQQMYNFFCFR